jgi:hypothetical protein
LDSFAVLSPTEGRGIEGGAAKQPPEGGGRAKKKFVFWKEREIDKTKFSRSEGRKNKTKKRNS